MNCTCKLGGKICGVCITRAAQFRSQKETAAKVALLEESVKLLNARVLLLEDCQRAQVTVNEATRALLQAGNTSEEKP